MKTLKVLSILLSLFLIITGFAGLAKAQPSNQCNDVLNQGIFNTVKFTSYDNAEEQYLNWLKTATDEQFSTASKAGLNIGLPIYGIPVSLGGDYSKDDLATFKSRREQLTTNNIKREKLIETFSKTTDQGIVNAWIKCIQEHEQRIGLRLDKVLNGNQIILTLNWTIPGSETAVINNFSTVNATLNKGSKMPKRLKSLVPVKLIYIIEDQYKPTVISINTSRGGMTDVTPAVIPPISSVKVRVALKEVTWERYKINNPEFGSGSEVKLVSLSEPNIIQSPTLTMVVLDSTKKKIETPKHLASNLYSFEATIPSNKRFDLDIHIRAGGRDNNFTNYVSALSVSYQQLKALFANGQTISRVVQVIANSPQNGNVVGTVAFEIELVSQ